MSFNDYGQRRRSAQEETARQNQNLAALNSIMAAMSTSLELPETLESLKNLLSGQFFIPGGVIFFYNENEDSLTLVTAWGVPAAILAACKKLPVSEYHYRQVVRDKEFVFQPSLRTVKPYSLYALDAARPNWQSYLGVPLVAKGEIQGVIDLFSLAPKEFTQEDVFLFTALGQQVGVAVQNARLFEEVRASRQRLHLLSQQLLEVQEAERRHIARELHDEIGQALTAVKVNLQAAIRLSSYYAVAPFLEDSISIVERTLQQIRDLSLDLRPSLLDDLGVVAALRWYLDHQARRAGFKARFIAEPPEMRLPPELETTCYRIVQEALTNIVRHARAKQVQVELHQSASSLELKIQDDGVGFDVNAALDRATGDLSLGLFGMQERVQLVGGHFKIKSDIDQGTEIVAYFPLPKHSTPK